MTPLRAVIVASLVAAVTSAESLLSDHAKLALNTVFYPRETDFQVVEVADKAHFHRSLQEDTATAAIQKCLGPPLDGTVTCSIAKCPNLTESFNLPEPNLDNVTKCEDVHEAFCGEGGALIEYYNFCPPCKAEFEAYADCIFDTAFAAACPAGGLADCDVAFGASGTPHSHVGMMTTFIGSMAQALALCTIM